jgi:hypothetical protein
MTFIAQLEGRTVKKRTGIDASISLWARMYIRIIILWALRMEWSSNELHRFCEYGLETLFESTRLKLEPGSGANQVD